MKIENKMVAWVFLAIAAALLFLAHGSAFGYDDYLTQFFENLWPVAWGLVAVLFIMFIVTVWPGYFNDGELFFPLDEGRDSWYLFLMLFVIFWLYHYLSFGVLY